MPDATNPLPSVEKDTPGRVRRFLLWVGPWIAAEQRRRDIRCWHLGHKGNPCRRCGRVFPPGGGGA